ncbi:hypothetical protein [Butyrivibrio sp. XBB1001]|uniref:hypothetical protein n=1 Tax=Butyrivibrio sp. XBB1001 TaxID=1280682 RepID=UPI000416339E|nr:hypothetical protein [Butyrivibrio sp. XBB1001]
MKIRRLRCLLAGLTLGVCGLVLNPVKSEATEGLSTSYADISEETNIQQSTDIAGNPEEEKEEEKIVIPQNNVVNSNGKQVKSTVAGNYYAWSVPGFAVITPEYELQKQANFMILEYFFVTTWDIDARTAPAAIDTMSIVAQSEEATLGASFQMTVSRLFSTKVYPMVNEEMQVGTMIEIPADFKEEGASYAVVCVRSGGVYEILPDLDEDPATITFNAHAGTGAYGILRYRE